MIAAQGRRSWRHNSDLILDVADVRSMKPVTAAAAPRG